MSDLVLEVTDKTFEQVVIKSEQLVLLEFWATWCGPCKMIAPVLEEIAALYKDRLTVAKIDIDQNEQTTTKYAIRSVPTLILFKNGEMVETKLGAMAQTQLTGWIDTYLS